MAKRLVSALLCLMLLFSALPAAMADKPRDILPLEYDSLPEPAEGQHHYLLCCTDTWTDDHARLGNTDGVILVTLDTKARRIIFTTLTREMLVKRPDGGIGRFTFIAKNYGPEELCKVVSTHFGVKVEKYAIFCMDDIQIHICHGHLQPVCITNTPIIQDDIRPVRLIHRDMIAL